MSRLLVATMLVSALVLGGASAAPGAVAGAKDPRSAKAVAALLAAKKLGCRDFASESAPSGGTSSTLPAGFDALAGKLKGASIGTCTVDGQQTLLVAFKTGTARKRFETAISTLPCLVIKVLAGQLITPGSGEPAGTLSIPLVDIGSRALVFGTGTAPGADRLDLAVAGATDAKIATATKGKVQTFSFTCP